MGKIDAKTLFSSVDVLSSFKCVHVMFIDHKYARYFIFMFVIYNMIHRRKAVLEYSLLVMSKLWTETKVLIHSLMYLQPITVVEEIKKSNICLDPAILASKRHIQTMAAHTPYLYSKYFLFWLYLKILIISNRTSLLWITLNPYNFCCFLII